MVRFAVRVLVRGASSDRRRARLPPPPIDPDVKIIGGLVLATIFYLLADPL
jgi:hypothetical protein